MTGNYIKILYRNLLRNKAFTAINLIGLAIGLASVILIAIYINYETSYDKFFNDSDRIYRVALDRQYSDKVKKFAASSVMLAPMLKEHSPYVEEIARFQPGELSVTVEKSNRVFTEPRFFFADSAFFEVFSYTFIAGNPETALNDANAVVISESTANRYFGTTDVIGQMIKADEMPLRISGVMKDTPANSHFHFDLVGSIFSRSGINNTISRGNWASIPVYTYVKLKDGVAPRSFEMELPELVDTYSGAYMARVLGSDWKEKGNSYDYYLQPIASIHLESKLDREIEPNSDSAYVYIISIIAVIILTISSINFINLSIARSIERAKEIGIRKVLGSQRSNIISQFLIESIVISFLSSILALGIVFVTITRFNQILGTSLSFQTIINPDALVILIAFILLVGIISGVYPAMVISALQPSSVLKGSYKNSSKGVWLRNSLITVQFIISVFMISGSIIVAQQMDYMRHRNLGFDKSNLLVIHNAEVTGDNYDAFYNEVSRLSGIHSVSKTLSVPGDFFYGVPASTSDLKVEDVRLNMNYADENYFEAMGIEILTGRGFDSDFNDSLNIIINEAAVKVMGIDDPLRLKLQIKAMYDEELTIIGVAKDFNYYSLHSEISPLVIFYGGDNYYSRTMIFRINSTELEITVAALTTTWGQFSELPLNYSFLDVDLDRQYEADRASGYVFGVFTLIAIIMSCTGLFGLAIYIVNQRSKEMSIRKVLGASMQQIVTVFSKYFLLLIGIAFLIGVPTAYLALSKWLDNFAYHVNIGMLPFILSGIITLTLVCITVSYHGMKIALVNPARILRND